MAKDQFLEAFGFMMGQELLKAAPKDTGRLARSFPATMQVAGNKVIYTLPEYAQFIEWGTAPHVIRAKDKKALKFTKGGENIMVKEVKHPGTRPNPFMRNTIHQKTEEILKRTIKFLEKD